MGRSELPPPPVPDTPISGRLESWKRIAAHFKRDVRTVKRWERDEGLPVHRHVHKKQATIYAYRAELDVWWKNRRPGTEQEKPRGKQARSRWWAVAAVTVVAVAAGAATWFAQRPSLPFAERDWVLITGFDNRTGEAVFDGTLEYALERELSQSRFVNVVPPERIKDSLRLMKKPLNTMIDRELGLEICLRDGSIRALLTGRVEKLVSTYVLSAALVEPDRGVAVASFSEEAAGQKEVVPAIGRLANQLRDSLGEELANIEQSQQMLEKVTTPSLRALQLYSRGAELSNEFSWSQAAELLTQAIAEDSQFASAHIYLAYALNNVGRSKQAAFHFQQAFELADTTTDRERFFIRASYHDWAGEEQKAAEMYQLLARLYPDHYWAASNLWYHYHRRGRPRQALPYGVRRADLRPNYFYHQMSAAETLLVWGDRRQAEPYLEQARKLVSGGGVGPSGAARLRLFPAYEHWLQGDLTQALQEAEQAAGDIASKDARDRDGFKWQVGWFYLTLGKWRAAKEMLQNISAPATNLALIAWTLDDEHAARNHLHRALPSHRAAVLLARTGLLSEAEAVLSDPETASRTYDPRSPRVWGYVARGELALARGQIAEAIRLLEQGLPDLRPWPTAYFFLASEALARAAQQRGNIAKALEILDNASQYQDRAVFFGPASFFWMKIQLQRAQLHRTLGREPEAQEIEADLRRLLALADADHAILVQLDL